MDPFGLEANAWGFVVASFLARRAVRRGTLTLEGAAAGFVAGYLIVASSGYRGLLLLFFYQLGSWSTKYGRRYKLQFDATSSSAQQQQQQQQHNRQHDNDRDNHLARGPKQVLAASALATLLSLLRACYFGRERPVDFLCHPKESRYALAVLAHHAASLADTWAGELGMAVPTSTSTTAATSQVRLITNWNRSVPKGTNGGITVGGTTWSLIGGAVMGFLLVVVDFASGNLIVAVAVPQTPETNTTTNTTTTSALHHALKIVGYGAVCGLVGSAVDSLLGATLQATYYDPLTKRVVDSNKNNKDGVVRDGSECADDDHETKNNNRCNYEHVCGIDWLSNEQVNFVSVALTTFWGGWVLGPWWFGGTAAASRSSGSDQYAVASAASTAALVSLTAAIATVLYYCYYYRYWANGNANGSSSASNKPLQRSFSFTSTGMVLGAFPERAKVPETIINAVLLFDAGDVPSDERLTEDVVRPMLRYRRLNGVPTPPSQKEEGTTLSLRECPDLDPTKLVRRIRVVANGSPDHADGEDDSSTNIDENKILYDAIFEHLQDPFSSSPTSSETPSDRRRDPDLPWWEILVFELDDESATTATAGGGGGTTLGGLLSSLTTTTTTRKRKSAAGQRVGGACVFRFHHGLADGIALVGVFEKIIKPLSVAEKEPNMRVDGGSASVPSIPSNSPTLLRQQQQQQPPPPPLQQRFHSVSKLWDVVKSTVHVLTLGSSPFDSDTAFSKSVHGKMVHTGNRDYVLFPTVPLDFVKRIKESATATAATTSSRITVNDVLMTVVSQAIHDYCLSENCPVMMTASDSNGDGGKITKSVQCRALLPIAFPRSPEELQDPSLALRNKFCLVSCDLGVHCSDVVERLSHIHATTTELKSSSKPYMQLLIQNTIPPLLPLKVGRQTVYDVFCRHSVVFSNVPGPPTLCTIAGGSVCRGVQMFYANLIPQVGLISYAGNVYGNIILDPNEIPNCQRLATFYAKAFVDLAERFDVDDDVVLPSLRKKASAATSS